LSQKALTSPTIKPNFMSVEHTYVKTIGKQNLQSPLRVYFAGKVRGDMDWRSWLFHDARIMSRDPCEGEINIYGADKYTPGTVLYGGPSALSCDHGCWHDTEHGIVNPFDSNRDFMQENGGSIHAGWEWPSTLVEPASCPEGSNGLSKKQAVERCMYQIHMADAIYAFIDSPDCHGTLAEIGFAYAVGVPIHLVFADKLENSRTVIDHDNHGMETGRDDFWFIKQMATTVDYGGPRAGVHHIAYSAIKSLRPAKPIRRERIKTSDRVKILTRDNYQCQMCGVSRTDGAVLEIDHIHPISKGGSNGLHNLQVLCRECNSGKSDKIIPMPGQAN
jgi:hypothetical protein